MKTVAKDGKLYAEVTLRDVIERTEDLSGLPMLSEIKRLYDENDKLRKLVRDVVLLASCAGCDVTKMQLHAHGGDWRTIWERMAELGVPGTEVEQ